MTIHNDIKVITIKPTGDDMKSFTAMLNAAISDCKQDGYTHIKVCINQDSGLLEIHAQRDDIYVLHKLPELPPLKILPHSTAVLNRRNEFSRKNYTHAQNTKYNLAFRKYKGRKK